MMRAAALALAVLSLAPLGACGFTPVYGTTPDNGPIRIGEIPGRTGHFLRQELVRSIGQGIPGVEGPADLEVSLKEQISRLAFAPDQAAARSDYIGEASFALRNANGDILLSGSTREAASFNFANAAYADVAAQTAAQDRLASLLAKSIRDKLFVEARDPTKRPATPPATAPTNFPPMAPSGTTTNTMIERTP
jgi:LPS-assembly lipoprotein